MPKNKLRRQKNTAEMKAAALVQPVREIDFVFECNGAEHVFICGDFNDWHPTTLHMVRNGDAGRWEKRLVIPPGRYEYKFVVDGKWLHDPYAQENVSNLYGSLNSVVEVRP